MSTRPGKPSGVKLGEKPKKQEKAIGHSIHKAGTHTESEQAAAENAAVGTRRSAHKAPTSLPPKKGGN
jgi:hypothetical protein